MPYYPPHNSYDRYAFLRWWCKNQWWVQIVVPCIICAGVIGALLAHWNKEWQNERQEQDKAKIMEMEIQALKEHPQKLDPELEERDEAWRVILMKQIDPSMPIPYRIKQLIVKHWDSIIHDMKPHQIQRLHDLLQDMPAKSADEMEVNIQKFDAPWKGVVTLEGQEQDNVKTDETENKTLTEQPPKQNPGLEEAFQTILEKQNDPKLSIPYRKKQLIVKYWDSIISEMKPLQIQRLHDLLEDQPAAPQDDVKIDVQKFEAPWKNEVSLEGLDSESDNADSGKDNAPVDSTPEPVDDGKDEAAPPSTENVNMPQKEVEPDEATEKTTSEIVPNPLDIDPVPVKETEPASVPESPSAKDELNDEPPFKVETSEEPSISAKTENSTPLVNSVSYFPSNNEPDFIAPILMDSPEEQASEDSDVSNAPVQKDEEALNQKNNLADKDGKVAPYMDVDILEPELGNNSKGRARSRKNVGNAAAIFEDVGPLEDNFLKQREEFIKKALEERNRKIEEFRKSQDPEKYIPSPWKRNPIVI